MIDLPLWFHTPGSILWREHASEQNCSLIARMQKRKGLRPHHPLRRSTPGKTFHFIPPLHKTGKSRTKSLTPGLWGTVLGLNYCGYTYKRSILWLKEEGEGRRKGQKGKGKWVRKGPLEASDLTFLDVCIGRVYFVEAHQAVRFVSIFIQLYYTN